ncbi:hypothetical protein DFH06DRAFT_1232269 [Mycena polygramma]|nr:hypothetical protein DFH06DRAFT_1232269 [Mycena polygramma]
MISLNSGTVVVVHSMTVLLVLGPTMCLIASLERATGASTSWQGRRGALTHHGPGVDNNLQVRGFNGAERNSASIEWD